LGDYFLRPRLGLGTSETDPKHPEPAVDNAAFMNSRNYLLTVQSQNPANGAITVFLPPPARALLVQKKQYGNLLGGSLVYYLGDYATIALNGLVEDAYLIAYDMETKPNTNKVSAGLISGIPAGKSKDVVKDLTPHEVARVLLDYSNKTVGNVYKYLSDALKSYEEQKASKSTDLAKEQILAHKLLSAVYTIVACLTAYQVIRDTRPIGWYAPPAGFNDTYQLLYSLGHDRATFGAKLHEIVDNIGKPGASLASTYLVAISIPEDKSGKTLYYDLVDTPVHPSKAEISTNYRLMILPKGGKKVSPLLDIHSNFGALKTMNQNIVTADTGSDAKPEELAEAISVLITTIRRIKTIYDKNHGRPYPRPLSGLFNVTDSQIVIPEKHTASKNVRQIDVQLLNVNPPGVAQPPVVMGAPPPPPTPPTPAQQQITTRFTELKKEYAKQVEHIKALTGNYSDSPAKFGGQKRVYTINQGTKGSTEASPAFDARSLKSSRYLRSPITVSPHTLLLMRSLEVPLILPADPSFNYEKEMNIIALMKDATHESLPIITHHPDYVPIANRTSHAHHKVYSTKVGHRSIIKDMPIAHQHKRGSSDMDDEDDDDNKTRRRQRGQGRSTWDERSRSSTPDSHKRGGEEDEVGGERRAVFTNDFNEDSGFRTQRIEQLFPKKTDYKYGDPPSQRHGTATSTLFPKSVTSILDVSGLYENQYKEIPGFGYLSTSINNTFAGPDWDERFDHIRKTDDGQNTIFKIVALCMMLTENNGHSIIRIGETSGMLFNIMPARLGIVDEMGSMVIMKTGFDTCFQAVGNIWAALGELAIPHRMEIGTSFYAGTIRVNSDNVRIIPYAFVYKNQAGWGTVPIRDPQELRFNPQTEQIQEDYRNKPDLLYMILPFTESKFQYPLQLENKPTYTLPNLTRPRMYQKCSSFQFYKFALPDTFKGMKKYGHMTRQQFGNFINNARMATVAFRGMHMLWDKHKEDYEDLVSSLGHRKDIMCTPEAVRTIWKGNGGVFGYHAEQ